MPIGSRRPRADGTHKALRILLGARREMTASTPQRVNRLRALLLWGDARDRALAHRALTSAVLALIIRRPGWGGDSGDQFIRREELRPAGLGHRRIRWAGAGQQTPLGRVGSSHMAPGLLNRKGVGPVSAA